MTFALCYTSIRPEYIFEVVKIWLVRAKYRDMVEVIIVVDANDADCQAEAQRAVESYGQNGFRIKAVVQPDLPGTCVKGWNLAAQHSAYDVLMAISDDFIPPHDWDEKLRGVAEEGWHLKDRVVKVWDGFNPDICTLSIITRARYERMGYIFYPGYLSLFCDTEFTKVAYNEEAVIDASHLLFEHHHHECGKRAKDQHDVEHSSDFRWKMGENLFNYRREHNFPIDLGPVAEGRRPSLVFNEKFDRYAVYVQATQDDFFLFEICFRMAEEGLRRFYFFIPSHYWSGEAVSQDDRAKVRQAAARLHGLGCQAVCIDMAVDFSAGGNRLEVETDLRNRSLELMWDDSIDHVIIVDGDELWHRGLMSTIAPYIEGAHAIQCPMIPVIGLPGYPVDGAMDHAVVYVKKGNKFSICRTPVERVEQLDIRGIMHFTATRRTREEIITKMRSGGHYDDPDYDFEGWIQRKLPNISPGMTDAHMYLPRQIWPMVRAWTPTELKDVPKAILPYLGLPSSYEGFKPKLKKISLVEKAKLLSRPPCQEKPGFYRVGVFIGNRH